MEFSGFFFKFYSWGGFENLRNREKRAVTVVSLRFWILSFFFRPFFFSHLSFLLVKHCMSKTSHFSLFTHRNSTMFNMRAIKYFKTMIC